VIGPAGRCVHGEDRGGDLASSHMVLECEDRGGNVSSSSRCHSASELVEPTYAWLVSLLVY